MNDSEHLLYINIIFCFDSSSGFLFDLLRYYDGCSYVKATKQILIAVCVVEFSGLHSFSLFVNYSFILNILQFRSVTTADRIIFVKIFTV